MTVEDNFKHYREDLPPAVAPIVPSWSPNSVANFGKFHLSFNDRDTLAYGSETTAIVLLGTVFLVLNGDHREALFEAATKHGAEGCLEYFTQNIRLANSKSEHEQMLDAVPDPFNCRKYALQVVNESALDKMLEVYNQLLPVRARKVKLSKEEVDLINSIIDVVGTDYTKVNIGTLVDFNPDESEQAKRLVEHGLATMVNEDGEIALTDLGAYMIREKQAGRLDEDEVPKMRI